MKQTHTVDCKSKEDIKDVLAKEIVVLDGAMGTMIQRLGLEEADYHCDELPADNELKGCNDLLAMSRPDVIYNIHRQYMDAGARIIETDSFNANSISLADYGVGHLVKRINQAAAAVARHAADDYMAAGGHTVWVAGSMGPTGRSLTMSGGLDDGAESSTCYDDLEATYFDQAFALIEGGVDLLLIETVFDGLNAKAAVAAARRAMAALGREVDMMISVTLTESGRTLSGQTLDAFVTTVSHARPLALGLNCGFGAETMRPFVEALQGVGCAVCVYPNAGLPNEMGLYDETPVTMSGRLRPMVEKRMLNIVGGCCGTTPEHIREIAAMVKGLPPRSIPAVEPALRLAGLESVVRKRDAGFMIVGERCNVAGSRKFLRLINEGNIDEAISIASAQIAAGAMAIDINMDDAMLDAGMEMTAFLRKIAVEPEVCKVPIMIDSSDFNVIQAALKCVQGRPIVNSISLKEGETKFIERAGFISSMGAAMVVMAFDEQGQADTFERKCEVCGRAYKLLTEAGIAPDDIIFDPNVLAVATGIEAHADYGLDFLRAVEWIKTNLPGARVSGGLSNLSFSFRGNNYVREAMHAVFLDHAIKLGMDMAIVNPSAMMDVDKIDPELRAAIDDVLVGARNQEATDRLIDMAQHIAEKAAAEKAARVASAAKTPVSQSVVSEDKDALSEAVVKGRLDGLDDLVDEALSRVGSAMGVIEGPLMAGMNKVGDLFGQGIMFLPQVVKSARTMKVAVERLTPIIEAEKESKGGSGSGTVVIATVKGDVHDIGKNIVDVIMSCNGYRMIDLGVMVPGEEIVDRAIAEHADFIGLSGLITPSLNEMCNVARIMEKRGLRIPLLIGGATTSALHTAVKIAPCYGGPVVYTRDAAALPGVAQKLKSDPGSIAEIRQEQERLRCLHHGNHDLLSMDEACERAPKLHYSPVVPSVAGVTDFSFSIAELRPLINRKAFLAAWEMDRTHTEMSKNCECCGHIADNKEAEVMKLWQDAMDTLDSLQRDGVRTHARVVILPAGRDDNGDIIVENTDGQRILMPILRRQSRPVISEIGEQGSFIGSTCPAVSDFIAPIDDDGNLKDYIGLFTATAGSDIKNRYEQIRDAGDSYKALLLQSVADRLAEASTELLHRQVAERVWGFAADPNAKRGIRPAFGYPSLPDQSLVLIADAVLHYSQLGISVTEHGALDPQSTTTGFIIAHPESRYTAVGPIADDQRKSYFSRHPLGAERLETFLPR